MHSLLRLDPWYAVVVLLINTADRVLMSFKWSQLLRSRHERLPLFRAMMIYCDSMVWGLLLPTTVGADVIRAASAARTGLKSDVVVSSIIIERLIGFVSAILLGIIGLFLLYATKKLDARFDLVIVSAGAMLSGNTSAI